MDRADRLDLCGLCTHQSRFVQQGALELTREMSLFRRRTDRMLKGLGSSNPLLSATQSGMLPYIMEKR